MSPHNPDGISLGRRAFLQNGTLLLAATSVNPSILGAEETIPQLQIGLVTDLHYADKDPAGTRHYRESVAKLTEAGSHFEKHKINFVVELGDLIDAADTVDLEQSYLKTINQTFQGISKDRHCVLGNHCVDTLTKDEFLQGVGQEKSYYSFDRDGFHFIVLDACFRGDGQPYGRKNSKWDDANIPQQELDWLKFDLQQATGKAIVFAHQRLDVSNSYGVKNCADVRKLLESSGKVLAVFQGHSHKNDLKQIAGIHYCTMVAMVEGTGVENNGYSILGIAANGSLRVSGFRNQKGYTWDR